MKFPGPLERGTLVARYKRFLADVRLPDGSVVTIHCPNTGSMKHCAEPGDEVWFSTSDNPKRKYRHTWELSRTPRGHYIGINTGRANGIIEHAISSGAIASLAGYRHLRREQRYGEENSRIDILLEGHDRLPDCYVEVKSVTLLEAPVSRGVGYFPDAVSSRASRHLRELSAVATSGQRAVLCFCVQHSGVREVRPADHIDPEYAEALRSAARAGVEVMAWKARLSPSSIRVSSELPVNLEGSGS
ncbi:MAG: DNA/RNA nuclease SfsA [Pseudomonadales bacterium]|nr:DNA/RNA nuclease SfsA [Pseudomonadales bacterium]